VADPGSASAIPARLAAVDGFDVMGLGDALAQPLKCVGGLERDVRPGADQPVKLGAGGDVGEDVHGPADAVVEVFELERLDLGEALGGELARPLIPADAVGSVGRLPVVAELERVDAPAGVRREEVAVAEVVIRASSHRGRSNAGRGGSVAPRAVVVWTIGCRIEAFAHMRRLHERSRVGTPVETTSAQADTS
jgi:hypothetical protein